MKNKSIIKTLSVGVIISLTVLVFSPTINANFNNIVTDKEFVEFTTEIYGIDGKIPHTIKLTQQESIELKELIDDIKFKLDKVETEEETIDVFTKAIIKINRYGLLPKGMTIKEALRVVMTGYQNQRRIKLIEQVLKEKHGFFEENENFNCLIIGQTDDTVYEGIISKFFYDALQLSYLILGRDGPIIKMMIKMANNRGMYNLAEIIENRFSLFFLLLEVCQFASLISCNIRSFSLGSIIYLGQWIWKYGWSAADGWIHSVGLNGIKSCEGPLWGDLPRRSLSHMFSWPHETYPGIFGFTGLKIQSGFFNGGSSWSFYLGSALHVKIKEGSSPN